MLTFHEVSCRLDYLRKSWRARPRAEVDRELAQLADAMAVLAPAPEPVASTPPPPHIACPHCHNTELARICWQEDIVSAREVVGYDADSGELLVDGDSLQDDPGGETGCRRRLYCLACYTEFPIPAGVTDLHGSVQDFSGALGRNGDVTP